MAYGEGIGDESESTDSAGCVRVFVYDMARRIYIRAGSDTVCHLSMRSNV